MASTEVTWVRLRGTEGRVHLLDFNPESGEFVTLCGFSAGPDPTVFRAADGLKCIACGRLLELREWSRQRKTTKH